MSYAAGLIICLAIVTAAAVICHCVTEYRRIQEARRYQDWFNWFRRGLYNIQTAREGVDEKERTSND